MKISRTIIIVVIRANENLFGYTRTFTDTLVLLAIIPVPIFRSKSKVTFLGRNFSPSPPFFFSNRWTGQPLSKLEQFFRASRRLTGYIFGGGRGGHDKI